jgi:hypothetical protein
VQFYDNGSALGQPVTLNSSGKATLSVNTLPAGTDTITARYLGNTHFKPSFSAPKVLHVSKPSVPPPPPTTTTTNVTGRLQWDGVVNNQWFESDAVIFTGTTTGPRTANFIATIVFLNPNNGNPTAPNTITGGTWTGFEVIPQQPPRQEMGTFLGGTVTYNQFGTVATIKAKLSVPNLAHPGEFDLATFNGTLTIGTGLLKGTLAIGTQLVSF